MSFKFENLRVWQTSMDLGERVYQVSAKFPNHEMYNLLHRFEGQLTVSH